jgi:hypothetical protein
MSNYSKLLHGIEDIEFRGDGVSKSNFDENEEP